MGSTDTGDPLIADHLYRTVLLGEGFRRGGLLPAFAVQGAKKCHEVTLFFVRQFEWEDQWILVRILDASLVVEIHNFFEVFEAAIMHIGGASGDFPQGRGLECAEFLRVLSHHVPAEIHFIVVPADAEIVELFVGEIEP